MVATRAAGPSRTRDNAHQPGATWGRLREGEEHLAASSALLEAEGLESAPLRAAWRMCVEQLGTLASRAMALARMGRYQESADWAVKAAARPNAHVHIQAIAAYSLVLADSMEQAQSQADAIRRISPQYSVSDFFAAFQFNAAGIELFRRAAERVQMA